VGKTFILFPWLLAGSACMLSGCVVAPAPPPMQTSVFGSGAFASTASPPVPYVNQGRTTPLQTLNSLPVGAATGISGPF
jgi:hypothetical protein